VVAWVVVAWVVVAWVVVAWVVVALRRGAAPVSRAGSRLGALSKTASRATCSAAFAGVARYFGGCPDAQQQDG